MTKSAPPQNWDSVTLDIDPTQLASLVDQADTLRLHVIDAVARVVTSWQSLELGWQGNTEVEVTDFGNRWASCMAQMFGYEGDPNPAGHNALGNVLAIMRAVAGNFDSAETAAKKMYEQVYNPNPDPFAWSWTKEGEAGMRDKPKGPVIEKNDPLWPHA